MALTVDNKDTIRIAILIEEEGYCEGNNGEEEGAVDPLMRVQPDSPSVQGHDLFA